MDNAMISKVEKAKRYAEERHRIQIKEFEVTVDGDNNDHQVTYKDGKFTSDDSFFQKHGYSQYTIAMERLLNQMITPSAPEVPPAAVETSAHISRVEKGKRYAEEKYRFTFHSLTAVINGDHQSHTIKHDAGKFQCDCNFFQSRGCCQHSMAIERVLEDMLPKVAAPAATT